MICFRLIIVFSLLLITACGPRLEFEAPTVVPPTGLGEAGPAPSVPLYTLRYLRGPVRSPSAQAIEAYANSFKMHATVSEFGDDTPWIAKWPTATIRWKITGAGANDMHLRLAREGFRLVGPIVGRTFVETDEDADVEVVVDNRKIGYSAGLHCIVFFQSSQQYEIEKTHIFIGEATPTNLLRGCYNEEISQMMGMIGDVDVIQESMWRTAEGGGYESLTWHDAILLRVLYNERIKPGMPIDEAIPIARELIAKELRELNEGLAR